MSLPTLIGLSGYATAGKDAAAAMLLADGWTRHSFADVLREFLYAVNPVIPGLSVDSGNRRLATLVDAIGWQEAKAQYEEVRALQQRTGTDAGRNVLGQNVWVDAALARVQPGQWVVFTDCRFPNEADAIRARGGLMVRVNRPGVGPVNAHPSETALDDYDFDAVIENKGTLEDLHAAIQFVAGIDRG